MSLSGHKADDHRWNITISNKWESKIVELAILDGNGMSFLFRWIHLLAGVAWIGLLWYFNFVQGEYFKEADASSKSDAIRNLVPRALWWFRWGAMFTFLTGVVLLYMTGVHSNILASPVIWMGAIAGTFMFLNVWLIIWPAQQIVLGMKEGDGPASAAKAGLASRTNTLFSGPMLVGMLGANHLASLVPVSSTAFYASVALIVALEINAVVGKTGPMTSVKGVIHCSIALSAIIVALYAFL
jgi:uncharacterized membrane protein